MPRSRRAAIPFLGLIMALSAAQAAPPPSPASPAGKSSTCKQEDPADVTMASSGVVPYTPDTISLKGCVPKGGTIVCSFVFTKKDAGLRPFSYSEPFFHSVLRDDLKEVHPQISGTFYDGRCKKVNSLALDKDEWFWFTEEFEGPTDGIKEAKLIFPKGFVLDAPIEGAQ